MTSLQKLNTLVDGVRLEYERFKVKPTKTGATRMRATLLQIKKEADSLRKEILAESKLVPVRSRKKVATQPEVDEQALDELPPPPPMLVRENTSTTLQTPPASPQKKTRKPRAKKN